MEHHIKILTPRAKEKKVRFSTGFVFNSGSVITILLPDRTALVFYPKLGIYQKGHQPNEKTLDRIFNTQVGESFEGKECRFTRVESSFIMMLLGNRVWYPTVQP